MKFYKTFRIKSEGGGTQIHIEGIGDSYTLCGLDTAGDDTIHAKQPVELPAGKHRVTCDHCRQMISIVREYLKASKRHS